MGVQSLIRASERDQIDMLLPESVEATALRTGCPALGHHMAFSVYAKRQKYGTDVKN